jgi:hypothetical protein
MPSNVHERLSEMYTRHQRERRHLIWNHLRLFAMYCAYIAVVVFGYVASFYSLQVTYLMIAVCSIGYYLLDRPHRDESKEIVRRQMKELMIVLRRILPKPGESPGDVESSLDSDAE